MVDWPWNRNDLTQIWKWPHIFWLNIFGWWAEEARTEKQRKWLMRYRTVIYVYQVITYTSMLIGLVNKFIDGHISEQMFVVFTGSSVVAGVVKEYSMITYRKSLKSVMEFVNGMFRQVKDVEEERIVRRALKRSWLLFVGYLILGSFVIMHWVFRPIIIAVRYGEKTRIFDSWPVFIDTWLQFAASFAFQSVGITTTAHVLYLYDNFFFCTTEFIICQFTLLKHRVSKIRLESEERRSVQLVHCIQFYAKLMRACAHLRNFSSLPIIIQSGLTVLGQCSAVFIVTMTDSSDSNLLINLIEVTVIITMVLYLYCWYCSEIKLQCQEVRNTAYMSDWIEGNNSSKKDLQLLMVRTEKPVLFGGILEVDMKFFVSVHQATFSYYNFLLACMKTNAN